MIQHPGLVFSDIQNFSNESPISRTRKTSLAFCDFLDFVNWILSTAIRIRLEQMEMEVVAVRREMELLQIELRTAKEALENLGLDHAKTRADLTGEIARRDQVGVDVWSNEWLCCCPGGVWSVVRNKSNFS